MRVAFFLTVVTDATFFRVAFFVTAAPPPIFLRATFRAAAPVAFFRVAPLFLRTAFLRAAFLRTVFFRVAFFRVAFLRDTFLRDTFRRTAPIDPGAPEVAGESSPSNRMPNSADRSSPASASSSSDSAASGTADTRSFGSTLRSRNNCSGSWSSRTPTPYNTAAACLHMSAQSGQEQSSSISFGVGKRPSPGRVTISITRFGGSPRSRCTRSSISPAHWPRMASHCFRASGSMRIVTR